MNFEQAYKAIQDFALCNNNLFSNVKVEFSFGANRPPIGDWSNDENMGMLIFGDEIGRKSGVYFYATLDGEIIYIGKAGQDNLHQRVWAHLQTPQSLTPDRKRIFPNHRFVTNKLYAEAFTSGDIRLGVVTISNKSLVSLLEVYLQTLHIHQTGELPALNRQIG